MMGNWTKTCVVAGLCVIALWLQVPPAHGSEAPASDPPAVATDPAGTSAAADDFSLTVSPTRLVVPADQVGEVQRIEVSNHSSAPIPVTVAKRDFTGGLDGTLVFQDTESYSASEWVTVAPESFEVAPGATQVVEATISVPVDPEVGDHQVALVFMVPAGETEANVKINRGIATPLYVTAPGPIDDSVVLTGLDGPAFLSDGSADLTATVRNDGTVHRDFRGGTRLEVGGSGHAEPFADFTVPRGASRAITTEWEAPLLCICHPTVSVVNADGTVQELSVQVIVFPWPIAVAVVGGAIALLVIVRVTRRRYRANVARAAEQLRSTDADAADAADPAESAAAVSAGSA